MFQNTDLYIDELANRSCTNCKNKDGYLLRTLPPQNPCDAWLENCYSENTGADNVCSSSGRSQDNIYFDLSKQKSPLRFDNYLVDFSTQVTIDDNISVTIDPNDQTTATMVFTKNSIDLNLNFLKTGNTFKIDSDITVYTITSAQDVNNVFNLSMYSESDITLNNSYTNITLNEISATLFDYQLFCDNGGFMRGCPNYNGCLLRSTNDDFNCGEIVSYSESIDGQTCTVDSGYFLVQKDDYNEIDTGFFRICKHKEDETSNSCFPKLENETYAVNDYSGSNWNNDEYNLCKNNYENCIIQNRSKFLKESAIGYIYSKQEKLAMNKSNGLTIHNTELYGKETGTPACSYTDCSDLGIELYFLHLFTYFKILHLKTYIDEDEETNSKVNLKQILVMLLMQI